ncbi:uncharacterized protein C11orf16 homolog isoform X3 [Manis javanica]|uniref:uncharacterized protein C11orf16 homolog isoform X3 n=1 Tax=Manis javanica TaxID=9974 RepID=UPI003C6D704A
MESSAGPGMPSPKYCSMARTLKACAWACAAQPCSAGCHLALQAPWLTWHNPSTRYVSYHPFLHIGDLACQGPGWLGTTGDAADTWVLARREPDGFYYRAQIKPAPELERQGALLVEFETPLVTDPKLPAQRQSVVLEEDVIQFPSSSLRPGDKVLALWGPGRQRYGPGTVLLGLEARDPQRDSLTKAFESDVKMETGRHAQMYWEVVVNGEQNQKKLLFTSGMAGQLQCLQVGSGPEEEEAPVQTPVAVSSSSSASSSASLEEDLENDPEMSLPQRLMADSTANTDPVLFEKSPRRQGGLCQPEWRYWRRNGYEPCPGKPGTRCFKIQKEEKGNQQQRAQMVLVGNTEELVVAATAAKALQILPGEAKRCSTSEGPGFSRD